MTTYPGSCHCGAIKIAFTSDKKPEEMRVGRCACSFCRRHGARTLGDPAGSVEFRAAPGSLVALSLRPRHHRLSAVRQVRDLCRRRHAGRTAGTIGIVNVNALDIRDTFDPAPPLHIMTARTRRAGAPGGESSG